MYAHKNERKCEEAYTSPVSSYHAFTFICARLAAAFMTDPEFIAAMSGQMSLEENDDPSEAAGGAMNEQGESDDQNDISNMEITFVDETYVVIS